MALAGSLQLSHGWITHKQHRVCGHCNQFRQMTLVSLSFSKRIMVRKGQAHLLGFHLSSKASLQDAWRFHLPNNLCWPLHPVSSRPNAFMCQSFLMPGQANETPILKVVMSALTRSCKNFQGNPLILKLAPAVAIMAFAVWGLEPLMRWGRKLFFHRSDSNWKKSRTYHVLISYLQPSLLWAGTALICRVLDPITLPSEASQAIKQRLLNFVRSLSTVTAFAYCLSSLIQQAQKFFMETNDSNDARNMGFQFAGKAVYTAVWVAAFSLFMELLGFSTQKWLTAGGLGTVLLTLAGREIFTNFLSSVMIHATRPFVANEWIQTKIEGYEVSGTVEHVGWWSPTIIRGEDREAIHIPNHKFTVNVVRNLSQKTHWRVKTHLAISHLDASKINNIVADMRKVLAKNPQVEQQRLHRRVFLDNVNPENQALFILVSCFVKTSHFEEYLCVKEAILMDLLRVISHHRARLATPIRTIQKIYGDATVENVPFSETIFARAGSATNRPFMLIEHSSKINSDDKAKARQTRQSEDQEAKGASTSDSKVPSPASDTSAASGSDNKPSKKASSGDARPKSSKVDSVPTASTSTQPPKSQLNGSDSVAQNSDGIAPSGPGNRPSKKANSGEAHTTGSKVNSVPTAATASLPPPNSQFDGLDSMGLNNKDTTPQTTDIATPGSAHMKHGSERLPVTPPPMARHALQENIVLGVALEGSKRTLPIEEGMTISHAPVETKERAAFQNTSGSLSAGKDKKEGQTRVVPGAAVNELWDQER